MRVAEATEDSRPDPLLTVFKILSPIKMGLEFNAGLLPQGDEDLPPDTKFHLPEDCHLDVVGVLARFNEPESYASWTSRGPGRDTHARQVKG